MRITFLGAAHEVTGSCYYLEAAGKRFLVDCGLKQGPNYFETAELPVAPSDLDFVLLTHAHIDHSGKLPLLYAQGFRGSIYTTYATADLCDIMLRDSAHIQMSEAEWKNRKGKRAGREEIQPLYNMDDAQGTIGLLVGCPYKQILTVADGIQIRFIDAGHLLAFGGRAGEEDCFFRGYRESEPAPDQRSHIPQKCGLCGDGVYLR